MLETPERQTHQSKINFPGYCGKLPQRGDFIRFGLSAEFANTWDEWISLGLEHTKRSLGDHWLQQYLHAPMWRFYLSSGLLGESAFIGLWFPSMDKVGRYFPFTFSCPIQEVKGKWMHDDEVSDFFSRLERIGMVALDEACDIEDVEEALDETQWPSHHLEPYIKIEGKLSERTTSFKANEGLNSLLFDIVRGDHPQLSFWWTIKENGETIHKIHDGMPDKESFIDFII